MKTVLKNLAYCVVFAAKEITVSLNGGGIRLEKRDASRKFVLLSLTTFFFLPGSDPSLPSRVGGTDETIP